MYYAIFAPDVTAKKNTFATEKLLPVIKQNEKVNQTTTKEIVDKEFEELVNLGRS